MLVVSLFIFHLFPCLPISTEESKSLIDSPIVLVHGTFGRYSRYLFLLTILHVTVLIYLIDSGKSYLLVVVVLFLCEILETIDPQVSIRILIAANTNVAGKSRNTI